MDKENLFNEIKKIASKYDDIEKIVLFGSRARGDNNRTSDVDLAVYSTKIPFKNEANFWLDIEDIDTLLCFDIVVISESISKELIENIRKEGVVIYE